MAFKITFELNPKPDEVHKIEQGLMRDSVQKRGYDPVEYFAFFIRDENNNIVGGCDGKIWCGCLYINHLWIDEALRGKGYGSKVMLSAENLGSEKKCTFAAANTMDLDALKFYKKLGYQVEFERHGYLKGSVLYYLRRDLSAK